MLSFRARLDLGAMAMKSALHPHYWNLIIRLFTVISGHSLGGSYPSAEVLPVYYTTLADWTMFCEKLVIKLQQFVFWRDPHHHYHVMPQARISLTLSRHFSLSFIASGRSSGLHPVSSHSCCMYVRAGRPAFARPYVGIHRSTSLMSSSLLLQQCPACLVYLTWIVF